MLAKNWFVPALAFTAVVGAGMGYVATRVGDQLVVEKLTAERNAALDCRRSGATVAPCPVVYRSTRIEWRDRIRTVQTPDPGQAERIAVLSAELAHAHRTIRNFARQQTRQRLAAAYAWQNGTTQYPYNTDERCPTGSVVVYDARLSAGTNVRQHSGDPNVCYVLTKSHELALSSTRG